MQAIFLDTETTGLDPFSHRLLEIAFKIVDIPSGDEKIAYQSIVKQPLQVWEHRNFQRGNQWLQLGKSSAR